MLRKKNSLALFLILLFSGTFAQTTALNWIKSECGHGASVTLFDALDSGYVVVQDYVMLGSCYQCGISSEEIQDLIAPFNAQYPGKVKFFSTVYDSSASCVDMTDWADTFNLNNTVFKDGTLEFNYYGNSGMPLVLVFGSANHTIFSQVNGYLPSDSTAIKNAIAAAITATRVDEMKASSVRVNVFPSPANDKIQVSISNNKDLLTCSILDERACIVKSFSMNGGQTSADISGLPAGFYFLRVSSGSLPLQFSKFIIVR